MIDTMQEIITKVRALIVDIQQSDFEVFNYENSTIFTLSEENINTITKVLKNGNELGSGDYDYDSTTNKITIFISLINGDKIEVDYIYYKYSDTEITEYVRAALIWISIYAVCSNDFEIETDTIYPTPNNKEEDLICIVAAIIIKPDYTSYRLPTLTITYRRDMDKESKIGSIIQRFYSGNGAVGIIEIN